MYNSSLANIMFAAGSIQPKYKLITTAKYGNKHFTGALFGVRV